MVSVAEVRSDFSGKSFSEKGRSETSLPNVHPTWNLTMVHDVETLSDDGS